MKILSIMASEFEVFITELEAKKTDEKARLTELEARILKLEQDQAEREAKKNHKFQTRCIQIAKEILNEEPMIEYRPPFLNGLELDAFFQKYRIALEVQGAQHRFHSTSWYKDVKKLEDIVNRDRKKDEIMEFFFLKYGMMKNRKSLSLKGYKKLRSLFV